MSGDDMIKLYWKTVSILLVGIIIGVFGLYLIKGIKGIGEKETESESVRIEENLIEKNPIEENPTESITEILVTTDSESLENENPLLQDAIFEVNKLMEWFFQAKFDCDVETLQQIVSPNDGYSAERLYEERYGKDESGLLEIESYHVKECYSKRGLTEGSFVVWVLVEVKYKQADTPAPALYRMYVCSGENGYYINNEVLEEEAAYRDEVSTMEDVQKLVEEVNQRFLEVVDQDEQLRNIVFAMEGADSEEEQNLEEEQSLEVQS